jgi:L-lactate utilization protein LutC
LLQIFAQRLVELGPQGTTELHLFEQAAVAEEFLRIRCEEHPRERVAVQGLPHEKREYALGITRAEALVADTGGLVIDMSGRADGRPMMLAETHVVVARPSQIVPTVAHAIVTRSVKRKTKTWGGYQVIVTGPSRTADVEKVLVIPAHGPKRLVVVLCEEPFDLARLLTDSPRETAEHVESP